MCGYFMITFDCGSYASRCLEESFEAAYEQLRRQCRNTKYYIQLQF